MSVEEQIMSEDKYLDIFAPNEGYCVLYPSNRFRNTRGFEIGEHPRIFPSFSWGIYGQVTRFDQSRASENI